MQIDKRPLVAFLPVALPWLVTLAWLFGTLIAFWLFELQMPRLAWCAGR